MKKMLDIFSKEISRRDFIRYSTRTTLADLIPFREEIFGETFRGEIFEETFVIKNQKLIDYFKEMMENYQNIGYFDYINLDISYEQAKTELFELHSFFTKKTIKKAKKTEPHFKRAVALLEKIIEHPELAQNNVLSGINDLENYLNDNISRDHRTFIEELEKKDIILIGEKYPEQVENREGYIMGFEDSLVSAISKNHNVVFGLDNSIIGEERALQEYVSGKEKDLIESLIKHTPEDQKKNNPELWEREEYARIDFEARWNSSLERMEKLKKLKNYKIIPLEYENSWLAQYKPANKNNRIRDRIMAFQIKKINQMGYKVIAKVGYRHTLSGRLPKILTEEHGVSKDSISIVQINHPPEAYNYFLWTGRNIAGYRAPNGNYFVGIKTSPWK
ncbi:MAG: hypothetical protein JRE65_01530 [Deltaproteobacteria bacterium]|jgi:hypothetical protein|nr:hypothetical protein [Deltaproteobacteria bacterium]